MSTSCSCSFEEIKANTVYYPNTLLACFVPIVVDAVVSTKGNGWDDGRIGGTWPTVLLVRATSYKKSSVECASACLRLPWLYSTLLYSTTNDQPL
jgi:hypothetical protein